MLQFLYVGGEAWPRFHYEDLHEDDSDTESSRGEQFEQKEVELAARSAKYRSFVQHNVFFFQRFPYLLGDILSEMITQDSTFKKILLRKIADIPLLNFRLLENAVALRRGQTISEERWNQDVVPLYKHLVLSLIHI